MIDGDESKIGRIICGCEIQRKDILKEYLRYVLPGMAGVWPGYLPGFQIYGKKTRQILQYLMVYGLYTLHSGEKAKEA